MRKQLIWSVLLLSLGIRPATAAQSIHATVYGIPAAATRLVGLLDGGGITSPTPFAKNISSGTTSTTIDIGTIVGGPYRLRILAQDTGANLLSSGKVTGIYVTSGATVNVSLSLSAVTVSINGSTPTSAAAGGTVTALFDIYDVGSVVRPVASSCWVDWGTESSSLANRKFGNLSNISGASYQCTVTPATPGNAPLIYYQFGTYAYEFTFNGTTPILLYPLSTPQILNLVAASTISLTVSSIPSTASRLVVSVDGGGLTAASVSARTVSLGSSSAVIPLGIPIGGPYRVRVLAHDESYQLLRTGSVAGIMTTSGGTTAAAVTLADVTGAVDVSTPSATTYGSALSIVVNLTDTGSVFRTGDSQCWVDYGTVAEALTTRRYGTLTNPSGSQFKCSVSTTAPASGASLYYRISAYTVDFQYERVTPLYVWPASTPRSITLAAAGAIALTVLHATSAARLDIAVDGGDLTRPLVSSLTITSGAASTSTTVNVPAGGPYRLRVIAFDAAGKVIASNKATGITVSGGSSTASNVILQALIVTLNGLTPTVAAPGSNVSFVFDFADSGNTLSAGAENCWVNFGEDAADLSNRVLGALVSTSDTTYRCSVSFTIPNVTTDIFYQVQTALTDFAMGGTTPLVTGPDSGTQTLLTHIPVTLATVPAGLTVTVDGTSYATPQTFAWVPGSGHTIAAANQDTIDARYLFGGWSDSGAASHAVTTPVTALTLTATFSVKYRFTLVVDPPEAGSISTNVPSDGGYYAGWIGITAIANPGYQFQNWTGATVSTRNPEATLLDRPLTVTAHFSGPPGVTVATSPPGLNITVDGVNYTSPRKFTWVSGSTHTIATANQDTTGTRYLFSGWSNGGAMAQDYSAPASDVTLTATFVTQYSLSCQASPSNGGTCTAVPAVASLWYDAGSIVQLTATAAAGYRFTGFSGDLTGATNRQMIIMSAARSVTANFSVAPANGPPTVTSASPASGATATQVFTFTFADPNGWQDLGVVNILLNNFLDGRYACYLAYVRSINVLYLVNDAGSTLLPGLIVNGSGRLSNSQCTVTNPTVTGNGNSMALSMNMSFPASFAGNKVFYLAARDSLENNSDWQTVGTWSVPPAATTSPRVTGMTPGRGSGSSGQVTFQFSDSHGWQNLGVVNMLLNNFLDGRFGCYMAYARTINVLYLVNDAGSTLLPGLVVNGSGTLANSQCTITNPTVSGSGNTMTLRMNISYGANFAGNRVWYLAARDVLENNSGWQTPGSWAVY